MLLGTAGLSARALRARRARWVDRVDLLCACGAPTRRSLQILGRTAGGGLDRVAEAELHAMNGECVDLHAALGARGWRDEARMRPLVVAPTPTHQRDQRALADALETMCGAQHQGFWQRLTERLAQPTGDPPEVTRIATEHLRVREAMCMQKSTLGAAREGYTLTGAEADESASRCER